MWSRSRRWIQTPPIPTTPHPYHPPTLETHN